MSPPLPLLRAISVRDPLTAVRALADLPEPFLLHSALETDRARWSFFGAEPFSSYRGCDYEGALAAFRRLAQRASEEARGALIPFTGGAVGYWAYDFGRRLERWRAEPGTPVAVDDLHLPDFALGFYDVVGAFDHATRETWLFSSGLPFEGERRLDHAQRRLERFAWKLTRAAAPEAETAPSIASRFARTLRANQSAEQYRTAVERVREHIRRGDLYQANLSQRWTLPGEIAEPNALALELHCALARHSPAPHAAFLGLGRHAIASASPERFLARRGSRVETRPIKGTRPRSADPREDARLADALRASEKDRAENVMIVDVLRNDLGRVCEPGSVVTSELCALESFPQVHHLTSTVAGQLTAATDSFALLHACFPGGSITGAPKIRAMELLDGLEPHRRHIYTGAIGYVDWSGEADWNVAIRTALVTPEAIHFAAGGGVTADSDPAAEYDETLHKAEGMRVALESLLGPIALEPGLAPAR